MSREVRSFTVDKIELRGEDGEAKTLVGHAAVFDSESKPIMGMFREVIAPGAFTRALEEKHDVRALFNHDHNIVLGRSKSGTLRMDQDAVGLRVEIDLPNTTAARDLTESVKRGDIDGMSFAFRSVKEEWEERGASDGLDKRTISDLELFDVSPVTNPAYPATTLDTRAAEQMHEEFRSSLKQVAQNTDAVLIEIQKQQQEHIRLKYARR